VEDCILCIVREGRNHGILDSVWGKNMKSKRAETPLLRFNLLPYISRINN